ncbi:MAG: lamin tail domain-containing protein [Candidatus Niyogibacteria bacterium]|nr:lamin tail domain-containing protein [Candidatus Niyogibacteria bacterium]
MENRRFVRNFLLITAVATFWLGPLFVYGYSSDTTHPALTDEIVDFFNIHHPEYKLSNTAKELVVKGSVDEDFTGRWMRHFYDPVYNKGVNYFGITWQTSKDWAEDTLAQATYKIHNLPQRVMYGTVKEFFSGDTDYSWDRAVYEYAWGDKGRAFEALGHTLHLIEDATVPDHTRDDPHPAFAKLLGELFPHASPETFALLEHFDDTNDSPYETWTAQFDRPNIGMIDDLARLNARPVYLSSLDAYFDRVANYSNNNFFSRDTIISPKYNLPIIEGFSGSFGFSSARDKFPLVRRIIIPAWSGGGVSYTIVDERKIILSNYWSRLSQSAVRNGAGIIKLFFDEVEKEKKTKILYNKNKSWIAKLFDATKEKIFNLTDPKAPQSQEAAIIQAMPDREGQPSAETQSEPPLQEVGPTGNALPDVAEMIEENVLSSPTEAKQDVQASPIQNQFQDQFGLFRVPRPGGGGGGGNIIQDVDDTQPPPTSQEEKPPSPVIISPEDFSAPFTTETVLFIGTAQPHAIIQTDTNATTTVNDAGNWQLENTFAQGTSTLKFFAIDTAGNQSTPIAVTLFVDSYAPDIDFHIIECKKSLSKDGCLITSNNITLDWSSSASDVFTYELTCLSAGNVCDAFPKAFDRSATNTILTLDDANAIYTFILKAFDGVGNYNEAVAAVEFFTSPVVINEIAWMGTEGHGEDEWIELYNPTSQSIAFNDSWFLISETDNSPAIALSGTIPAGGYYLIERKNSDEIDEMSESPITDIPADLWVSFSVGLKDSGEALKLTYASSTIDRTALCTNWCAGSLANKSTMERFDPFESGSNAVNWGTNNVIFTNGINKEGRTIRGTPKARNSINYQIANGAQVIGDVVLTKSHGPYLVPARDLIIENTGTLTIEPGVIIKFFNNSGLIIKGTLKAEGINEDPVIFTSFFDDEYGGDFNRDGTSTGAFPGSWESIHVTPESANVTLQYSIIRYGGKFFIPALPNERAALRVNGADIAMQNSIVEHSFEHGIALIDSGSVLEKNTIRLNNNDNSANGLLVEGGSPLISENIFRQNTFGIHTSNAPHSRIQSNNFIENGTAIFNSGLIPLISNNSGSSNDVGGILVDGLLDTGTTTLLKNDLPYILHGTLSVGLGSTLTFERDTVVKGKISSTPSVLRVIDGGKIFFLGSEPDDLIFTSFYDDSVAGDSDNATSTIPLAGDWIGIRIEQGGILDMSGFTLRYAGGRRSAGGDDKAGVKIAGSGATSTIEYALIEKNFQSGIYLTDGAAASIKNSIVRDHTEKRPDAGKATALRIVDSSINLASTTFENNELDISASGSYSFVCGACTASTTDPDPL